MSEKICFKSIYIFLIMIFFSAFVTYLVPKEFSKLWSLGRECLYLFIVILLFNNLFSNKKIRIKKTSINLFGGLLIGCMMFYSCFTNNKASVLSNLMLYVSGILLFLLLYNSRYEVEMYFKVLEKINVLLILFILLNFLVYPFQKILITYADIDYSIVYKHLYRNGRDIRFFGLTYMPTVLAFVCVCIFCTYNGIWKQFVRVISLLGIVLTTTRVFIPGLVFGMYIKFKSKMKAILLIPLILLFGFLIYYLSISTESSIVIHLRDFLVEGPKLVGKFFYGIGLGNIEMLDSTFKGISVESDIYLYSIQFGIGGCLIYLALLITVFVRLIYCRRKTNDQELDSGILLLVTYFFASFIFPLTMQRTINILFWTYEGIYLAYADRKISK